jgi:hypothetical protein
MFVGIVGRSFWQSRIYDLAKLEEQLSCHRVPYEYHLS